MNAIDKGKLLDKLKQLEAEARDADDYYLGGYVNYDELLEAINSGELDEGE